jgi:hypothetical protein
MTNYSNFKKELINSYFFQSERNKVKTCLSVLEDNDFHTPEEIAKSLCVLYQAMLVPYESILKLIKYFWSSNIFEASKIFEEKRKNYEK